MALRSIHMKKPVLLLLSFLLVFSGFSGLIASPASADVDDQAAITASSGPTTIEVAGGGVIDPAVTLRANVLAPYLANLNGAIVSLDNAQTGDKLVYQTIHGITGSYSTATQILTLRGKATTTVAEYQEALRSVRFETTSKSQADRNVVFSLGSALPFSNGHFYEFIPASGLTWSAAINQAAAKSYFGRSGYLATVTSAAENNFITGKTSGRGWLGARDINHPNGDWRWVTGPEGLTDNGKGLKFYSGYFNKNGQAVSGRYTNWDSGEPNNYGGYEYVVHIFPDGSWNDYSPSNTGVNGYVIEYGGMPNDVSIQISASKTIKISVGDPTDLQDLVNQLGGKNAGDYTNDTWPAFNSALNAAKQLLSKLPAKQSDLDAARKLLQQAADDLVYKEPVLNGLSLNVGDAVYEYNKGIGGQEIKLYPSDSVGSILNPANAGFNGAKYKNYRADVETLEDSVSAVVYSVYLKLDPPTGATVKVTFNGNDPEHEVTPDQWDELVLVGGKMNVITITVEKDNQTNVYQIFIDRSGVANTEALREFVNGLLNKYNPDDYTAESWKKLQDALKTANDLLDPSAGKVTQKQVNDALEALEKADQELVNVAPLRATANEIGQERAGMKEADYTADSWKAVTDALAKANSLLEAAKDPANKITQAEVDAARDALRDAREKLRPVVKPDKAALKAKSEAIDAEKLVQAAYTPSSWATLQAAQAKAKAVLQDESATQAQVDAALAALNQARANLVATNAKLSKLAVSDANNGNPITLTPAFDADNSLNYSAVVKNEVDRVSLDALKADDNSKMTVKLNGKEVPLDQLDSLPLVGGLNVIEVEVVGPNGEKNTYRIEIFRVSSKLQGLVPSVGELTPAFAADQQVYNLYVDSDVESLRWTPTALDPQAVIEMKINDGAFAATPNGALSAAQSLQMGSNKVEFKVTDRDGKVTTYTVYVQRGPVYSPPYMGGGIIGQQPDNTGINTTNNGKDASFATASETNGTTEVAIDKDKLAGILADGQGHNLKISVPNDKDISVKGLTAEALKQLADSGSTLEIGNLLAIYHVPGQQLDFEAIAGNWSDAELSDIEVQIEIKRADEALIAASKLQAQAEGSELLVDAVQLDLIFSYKGETMQNGLLNGYAPRYIALPEGIDPNRITTGVIINPDGTMFHVPTVVTQMQGRYFAMINDLRDSGVYSVIWNPKTFADVVGHWAEKSVNNMASRLNLAGTGGSNWSPSRDITRAEFARIVVLGLGLMRQDLPQNDYYDVNDSDWYRAAVGIASEFDIVHGYDDGAFRGEQSITREQGFAMIARAYQLIDPSSVISQEEAEAQLASFNDGAAVANWAKASVGAMIQAGIVQGHSAQNLSPQGNMTRAEAVSLLERILQQTGLIDRN